MTFRFALISSRDVISLRLSKSRELIQPLELNIVGIIRIELEERRMREEDRGGESRRNTGEEYRDAKRRLNESETREESASGIARLMARFLSGITVPRFRATTSPRGDPSREGARA